MHCSPEINPRLHLGSHRINVLDESEAAPFEWYFVEGKGIIKKNIPLIFDSDETTIRTLHVENVLMDED